MNPVFIGLVALGAIVLWFLLSFTFRPLGKFIYSIWSDVVDGINEEEKEEKKE